MRIFGSSCLTSLTRLTHDLDGSEGKLRKPMFTLRVPLEDSSVHATNKSQSHPNHKHDGGRTSKGQFCIACTTHCASLGPRSPHLTLRCKFTTVCVWWGVGGAQKLEQSHGGRVFACEAVGEAEGCGVPVRLQGCARVSGKFIQWGSPAFLEPL